MANIIYNIDSKTKLSSQQKNEIKNAQKRPITYDDDCPGLSEAQLKEFAELARKQKEERKRKVVALRLLPTTLEKAKMLGKGYTAILSRMIDLCIDDKELLEKCL
jgi:uncharacterized protein (DUF4415 family)